MENPQTFSPSPHDTDATPWELLDRYFAGESSSTERDAVEDWSKINAETMAEFRRLQRVWEQPFGIHIVVNVEDALACVHARLATQQSAELTGRHERGGNVRHTPVYKDRFQTAPHTDQSIFSAPPWMVGAIGLFMSVVAIVISARVGMHRSMGASVPHAQQTLYSTARGQRSSVQLADGTHVMLNSATTLTIERDFGAKTRNVTLDGEAGFTVQQSANAPFIVQTGMVRTKVLGTTFDVRSYREDTMTRVAVADGRVSVGTTVLGHGDVAFTTDGTAIRQMSNQNVSAIMAWQRGVLEFSQTPVALAVRDLERFYDVDITLDASNWNDRLVTGVFTGRTVDELTLTLEYVFNVRVVRDGRALFLLHK